MNEKPIFFGNFEFPRVSGLEYLVNEEKAETDYLFVNAPNEEFSMYFEDGFPTFSVPSDGDREYCLLEMKRQNRTIKFFCPERKKGLGAALWYFYVELFDESGVAHGLPGQVRVSFDGGCIRQVCGKPVFIEVLETVRLKNSYA